VACGYAYQGLMLAAARTLRVAFGQHAMKRNPQGGRMSIQRKFNHKQLDEFKHEETNYRNTDNDNITRSSRSGRSGDRADFCGTQRE